MSPAATSTASPAKAGEFDTATLFVADKSARDEAALSLATAAKKSGVEFFGSVGLNDALVKVSFVSLTTWDGETVATRENLSPNTPAPQVYRLEPLHHRIILTSRH
jgi:hypothetical protein